MNYLTIENVTKSYGEKILFENLSFFVEKGQRIAFVARNGTGKSTLLKIIAGIEKAEGEHAKVLIHKDVRMGYLDQDPNFAPHLSVIEAVFESDNPMLSAIQEYEEALLYPEDQKRIEMALAQMDELKAWEIEVKVKEILSRLVVNNLDQKMGSLSGGQQKRVALAKILIEEPDFLILDEPTNHLDLDMVEWLENFLSSNNITVFMVTHDRYFLDRVCTVIMELERGKLHRYKGNYTYFIEQKNLRFSIESRTVDRAKRMVQDELKWVQRMPKARGTKAKARMDAFIELKKKASKKIGEQTFSFNIKQNRLGKKILELHYISKAFGKRQLIKDFDYKFRPGEKVGIVGRNGSGKSTFLRLLTQELKPDKGRIEIGTTVIFGHYKQDGITIKDDQRVIDVIRDIAPFIELGNGSKMYAEQFLERFLFPKGQHRQLVEKLSGGEKRRLYLLTILLQNPNFLILDEPTNDLDILTLNVLEQFLMEFKGCLVVVSHDRYFLDKLVEHLFVFEGNGHIRDFNGTYTEYRIDQKERDLAAKRVEREAKVVKSTTKSSTEKRRLTYKEQKEFEQLEADIDKLEDRKTQITAAFSDPTTSGQQISELSKELSDIETTLEEKEMRWMELAEWA